MFLGVKAYEYTAKFPHGIYPWYPHSLIHERADIYYASAVRIAPATCWTEIEAEERRERASRRDHRRSEGSTSR